MTTNNMKNYSRVKRHASGIKWGKPVFVPEYKEAQDNSRIAQIIMLVIMIAMIAGLYMMMH